MSVKVKLFVLDKLVMRGSFCKNHVSETDLKKNIVPFKCSIKEFSQTIKELRNEGFLRPVRKSEIEYCIHFDKKSEVIDILKKWLAEESKVAQRF